MLGNMGRFLRGKDSVMLKKIAGQLVGLPYKEHGRDENGIDCYGLAILLFKKLGIELPDYQYKPDWYEKGYNFYLEHYHECAKQIDSKDLKEKDLLLFRVDGSPVPNHLGIWLGEGRFIQCLKKTGVIITELSRQPFYRQFHSCYRLVNNGN